MSNPLVVEAWNLVILKKLLRFRRSKSFAVSTGCVECRRGYVVERFSR
jgi:hypothetical protein